MLFFGNTYRALRFFPWVVGLVTALAYVAAMPGIDISELAWVWMLPMALWSLTRPSWKQWLLVSFVSMWLAKIAILIWLRHIYPPLGWVGLIFATGYFALYPTLWLAWLRWLFPKTLRASLGVRLVIQLGLAGAWVLLEWVQGWLFTGCPWLLLADTQWLRPAVLSLCTFGGPWGLSFAIVLFNIGLARYAARLLFERGRLLDAAPGPMSVLRQVCPEFYLGVAPIFLGMFFFYQNLLQLRENSTVLFTAAAVQTDFDPNAKWDAQRLQENTDVVRDLTLAAGKLIKENPLYLSGQPTPENPTGNPTPHLILWPEAALPYDVFESDFQRFVTQLAKETGTTLLFGGISYRNLPDGKRGYDNGIYVATSEGVSEEFYSKRQLVPFGEYIPFPFNKLPIRTIVPVGDANLVGERNDPLAVPVNGGTLLAGALVCYEDIFPAMGRDLALRGADFIAVVTNDAWYGREAGAYQHAAHCAVLAASLQIPVIRCGNNGWSGVFNPLGRGEALKDENGSVYFRGVGRFEVIGAPAPLRQPTFYLRHGDWVVTFSGLLTLWAFLRNRQWRRRTTKV